VVPLLLLDTEQGLAIAQEALASLVHQSWRGREVPLRELEPSGEAGRQYLGNQREHALVAVGSGLL
jgi:hypothetical protein